MALFGKKTEDKKKDKKPEIKKSDDLKVSEKKSVAKKPVIKKEDKTTTKKISHDNAAYKILLRPIISEKATIGVSQGKYVFEVSPKANKVSVKKAVQEIYGVEPIKVNMINQIGKFDRRGRQTGRTKNTRKAVVTLKKGETIKLYEGI